MNKIACFRLGLFASLAVLLSCPADSFSQTQSASQTPSARPVPPTAVRGSRRAAPARSNADAATSEQPLGLTLYNCGNPSNEEQYQLELMNRARANPAAEGVYLSMDSDAEVIVDYNLLGPPTRSQVDSAFATYPARPPLAFNGDLCRAARGHDTVMLALDSQYHYLDNSDSLKYPQDGGYLGPEKRIDNAGYTNWSGWGENVFAYGVDMDQINSAFLVDWGNLPDLGHRHNIMNFASTDQIWNEVGIGILDGGTGYPNVGTKITTEDFGLRATDASLTTSITFVLGVVYTDSNKNGVYDMGEGNSGVTMTLSSGSTYYAVTTASGGYAIPYTGSGSVTLTASGGPFSKPVTQTVNLSGVNVKVDFIATQSAPGKVTLLSPINGATVKDTVTFTWDASAPAVSNYVLLVSKNANLSKLYAVNDTINGSLTADTASQFRLQPSTTYYWGVLAENEGGTSVPGTIWSFKTPAAASVDEPTSEETATSISPNPTAGESHIRFTLLSDADVSLRVFNTLGVQIQSFALGHLSPSSYNYTIDISKFPSGSYTYRLVEGDQTETGRIIKW